MRGDFPAPIVADAKTLQLFAHLIDIVFRPITRIYAFLYRGLFGRLPKRIPANRMQNIVALQTFIPRQCVADRIVANMPHVKPSRRIRQHFKRVKFLACIVRFNFKRLVFRPTLLPFLFYLLCKIFFVHIFRVESRESRVESQKDFLLTLNSGLSTQKIKFSE